MLNQANAYFKWTYKINEILTQIGRPDIWLNQKFIINKSLTYNCQANSNRPINKQHWTSQLQYKSYKTLNFDLIKNIRESRKIFT
jgi:hypothetical protein